MRLPIHAVAAALLLVACHHRTAPPPAPLPASIPPLAGPAQVVMALTAIDAQVGTGALVAEKQCVYAHYTGWLRDGTKFDSSRDTLPTGAPRTPIGFPLGTRRVISGWDLGVAGMRVGGRRRLFIPYLMAYGESGRPPVIPAKAELIFDIEVMAVADTLSHADSQPQRGPAPQCPRWESLPK